MKISEDPKGFEEALALHNAALAEMEAMQDEPIPNASPNNIRDFMSLSRMETDMFLPGGWRQRCDMLNAYFALRGTGKRWK